MTKFNSYDNIFLDPISYAMHVCDLYNAEIQICGTKIPHAYL